MLETIKLSKKYNEKPALQNLNLKVNQGEIFCLLGANGAGKTTTINLFLNFIAPSSGQALINEIDVSQQPVESKKYLAYIPENLMLYPQLSGLENLDYFIGLAGKTYDKKELSSFLSEVGLQTEAHHTRVRAYSKGMRQKVGIAITLAKEADNLLLDEPTSGLDPQASNEFGLLLQNMRDKGVATLMATHDLFRAKETGTHIGIMKQGELKHLVKADEITLRELEELYLDTMKINKTVLS